MFKVCRCFCTYFGTAIFGDGRSHDFCAHQNIRCTGVNADLLQRQFVWQASQTHLQSEPIETPLVSGKQC